MYDMVRGQSQAGAEGREGYNKAKETVMVCDACLMTRTFDAMFGG